MDLSKKDELKAYWNSYVQKWAKDPEKHFRHDENVFKKISNIKFDPFALPEPYFGDPEHNSVVILNYNPGPVMDVYQHYKRGKFITEAKADQDYYEFAKAFPYLKKYKNNPGGKWWNTRRQWINRLSIHAPWEQHDKIIKYAPFAMEICPWHSDGFKLTPKQINSLADYITQNVLEPAEAISKSSLLPYIISVGKDYQVLFQELGFRQEFATGPDDYSQYNIEYPRKADGKRVTRFYSIWRSPGGGIYLNTYSPGSNSCPAGTFIDVERVIIQKVYSLLDENESFSPISYLEKKKGLLDVENPVNNYTPKPVSTKMQNIQALNIIKQAVEKEINRKGWSFPVYPLEHGIESVLFIRKQDLSISAPHATKTCQLIQGGKKANPFDYGFFDDLQVHIDRAMDRLYNYANTCGL